MSNELDQVAGLWLSVSELADERKCDKSSVSRRVAQLEADGLLTSRKGPRGTKLVNVAAYDRAAGGTVDAIRELAEKGPKRGGGLVLAREQARRVAYQADIAHLDLEERQGKLVRTDEVVTAAATCAEAILLALEQLPSRSDEVAAAVGREGPQGARACLKGFAYDVRKTIERAMADLAARSAAAAPTVDGSGA